MNDSARRHAIAAAAMLAALLAVSTGAIAAPLLKPGAAAKAAAAPAPVRCTLRGGFQFLCYGQVVGVTPNPIIEGTPFTLTVAPTSGYAFGPKTVIVLEPAAGVGLGVGLRTLCGGLKGGAMAPPCAPSSPKSMTLTIPVGQLPPGWWLLRAENWNPAVVVAGVGTCTPVCTEADAGLVRVATTPPSSLQITSIVYPAANGQIGVNFIDPTKTLNRVTVLPWTGYQWGSPIGWNPGTTGMTAGELFIAVNGCRPGTPQQIQIVLTDAAHQGTQATYTFTCR